MPWREPVTERQRFCVEAEAGLFSFAELCRRYGISRKTGYKWWTRWERAGPVGLEELSHRPHFCPHATEAAVVQAILHTRRYRPRWGAPKIRRLLLDRFEPGEVPSVTTVHNILRRHDLVPRPRRSRRRPHPGRPLTPMDAPNAIWTADFKGQFRTLDGTCCYPLTVQDGYSRFLLTCSGLPAPTLAATRPVFQRLFRHYGLPERIRTDNGPPFASCALGRLSRLSVWWVTLNILPELIEPGQPQQNGRHERMHRTLKAETTQPPSASLPAQQRRFHRFRREFNERRPHQALDQETPASRYASSPRPWPGSPTTLDYPAHFERRLVSGNGGIRWHRRWVNVSHLLNGHHVGLEQTGEHVWTVYFGPLPLGWLDESVGRILDRRDRLSRCRKVSPINLE